MENQLKIEIKHGSNTTEAVVLMKDGRIGGYSYEAFQFGKLQKFDERKWKIPFDIERFNSCATVFVTKIHDRPFSVNLKLIQDDKGEVVDVKAIRTITHYHRIPQPRSSWDEPEYDIEKEVVEMDCRMVGSFMYGKQ